MRLQRVYLSGVICCTYLGLCLRSLDELQKLHVEVGFNEITGHYIGVTWIGKDEKTRDALDRFHKLIDSEERLVIAVTYSSVQNTEHNVDTLVSAADESKQSQKDLSGKMDQLSKAVTGKSNIPL